MLGIIYSDTMREIIYRNCQGGFAFPSKGQLQFTAWDGLRRAAQLYGAEQFNGVLQRSVYTVLHGIFTVYYTTTDNLQGSAWKVYTLP